MQIEQTALAGALALSFVTRNVGGGCAQAGTQGAEWWQQAVS